MCSWYYWTSCLKSPDSDHVQKVSGNILGMGIFEMVAGNQFQPYFVANKNFFEWGKTLDFSSLRKSAPYVDNPIHLRICQQLHLNLNEREIKDFSNTWAQIELKVTLKAQKENSNSYLPQKKQERTKWKPGATATFHQFPGTVELSFKPDFRGLLGGSKQ